ncbi:hypothetical protein FB639_004328, partial [Coemansia asiatica]
QEQAAERKLDAIKAEHQGRVHALERAQQRTEEQARRIEMNLEFVDQAITVIRQAVAAGMDWEELAELVRDQKELGNPVAQRITGLNLAANQITLSLDNPIDEDEDDSDQEDLDEIDRGPIAVDVDIFETAFGNAQRYYTSRRQANVKHAKTLAVSTQALQSAEQKIRGDLRATKTTATVTQQRKPLWFEKFAWFVSSDGILVIAGHDMHQNELLVKRYLRPGDAYVHADLHGAASVIVKNPGTGFLPPSTLFQAGVMSVCRSRAWDAKIVTSAWWVEAQQVSKTAPTGEYLATGSFMVRGKKNFLPPTQLVYGFGFLFRLADDESIARHAASRQQRMALMQEGLRTAAENEGGAGEMDFVAAREKYNLEEVERATEPNEEDELVDSKAVRAESKRNISARERRDQRKQKNKADVREDSSSKNKKKEVEEEKASAKTKNVQKRGKKGKQRKIKEKYADQDDLDRELRMALLGSGGSKNIDDVLEKHVLPDALETLETLAVSDDGRIEDDEQQQSDNDKDDLTEQVAETAAAAAEDSGDDDNDEPAPASMDVLDTLTGTPLPGDNLHSAIPVCAPYAALSSVKYRVKLVPGTMKKGKACKMATAVMLASADSSKPRSVRSADTAEAERLELQNILANRERELMKAVPEPEMIAQMLGKVKVSAPNIEAMRQKSKAAAKSRAKSKSTKE